MCFKYLLLTSFFCIIILMSGCDQIVEVYSNSASGQKHDLKIGLLSNCTLDPKEYYVAQIVQPSQYKLPMRDYLETCKVQNQNYVSFLIENEADLTHCYRGRVRSCAEKKQRYENDLANSLEMLDLIEEFNNTHDFTVGQRLDKLDSLNITVLTSDVVSLLPNADGAISLSPSQILGVRSAFSKGPAILSSVILLINDSKYTLAQGSSINHDSLRIDYTAKNYFSESEIVFGTLTFNGTSETIYNDVETVISGYTVKIIDFTKGSSSKKPPTCVEFNLNGFAYRESKKTCFDIGEIISALDIEFTNHYYVEENTGNPFLTLMYEDKHYLLNEGDFLTTKHGMIEIKKIIDPFKSEILRDTTYLYLNKTLYSVTDGDLVSLSFGDYTYNKENTTLVPKISEGLFAKNTVFEPLCTTDSDCSSFIASNSCDGNVKTTFTRSFSCESYKCVPEELIESKNLCDTCHYGQCISIGNISTKCDSEGDSCIDVIYKEDVSLDSTYPETMLLLGSKGYDKLYVNYVYGDSGLREVTVTPDSNGDISFVTMFSSESSGERVRVYVSDVSRFFYNESLEPLAESGYCLPNIYGIKDCNNVCTAQRNKTIVVSSSEYVSVDFDCPIYSIEASLTLLSTNVFGNSVNINGFLLEKGVSTLFIDNPKIYATYLGKVDDGAEVNFYYAD